MGSAFDPDEILADFTRAGIGQMLQKRQMASPMKKSPLTIFLSLHFEIYDETFPRFIRDLSVGSKF